MYTRFSIISVSIGLSLLSSVARCASEALPTPAARKPMTLEAGRAWWAFQPVKVAEESPGQEAWGKTRLDSFILAKLRQQQLEPSAAADRRTLIQRAYLDLTGLRANFEQVEAFANDSSPDSYARVIEQLLDSPRYGERWGRYWLDVARYGEDNPTSEATNPPYPFAWRYRDWVIEAVNNDMPYDRFVKLQLAADLMPGVSRHDMIALGFLGAAPVYHKDGRLSKDVIETLYTDDWDERVDTVTRGILGLTVACARCHDHKFDPISTRDYYALAGIFASTVAAPRPMAEVDKETEAKFMAAEQRLFYLSYAANLLRGEPGSKPVEARQKVIQFVAEIQKIEDDLAFLKADHPEMYAYLLQLGRLPNSYRDVQFTLREGSVAQRPATRPAFAAGGGRGRGRGGGSNDPFFNAVFDAGLWIDGSDPDFTKLDMRPGEPRDMHVLPGGNVARPGDVSPRRFIAVLAKDDSTFHQGSGRRELADRIFSDSAPLAARVLVNRVWGWHFGKPLVATPSDFGAQGERPSHPELLNDLAARFIEHGWSLKWLHREIMLSATYQQSSRPREEGAKIDPTNRFLWRMNPRRLEVEAYRDCLLQAAGALDPRLGGISSDLDQPGNYRRSVYGRIGRGRLSSLFQLYDFPEPTMHAPERQVTTTPLQQLFVMNSAFIQEQAASLAKTVESEPDAAAKVRGMYRRALSRNPSDEEMHLALDYLTTGSLTDYAQAVLATNEEIFWP